MGNLCFKKNEPIYIPYYSPISPKISPIVNKSSNNPKKLKEIEFNFDNKISCCRNSKLVVNYFNNLIL